MARETKSFALDFDVQPIELTNGDGRPAMYELREMGGAARDKYMKDIFKRTKMVNGKPMGIKDFEGMHEALLNLCLYNADGDQVKKEVIAKWPARVTGELFNLAHELSGLQKPTDVNAEVAELLDRLDDTSAKMVETLPENQYEFAGLYEDHVEIVDGIRQLLELKEGPEELAKNG